jgi:exosortase
MAVIAQNGIKLVVLLVLWVSVFYPVFAGLVHAWFYLPNSDNSYGVLVPFISMYFIWQKREALAGGETATSAAGFALLAASLSIYLLSQVGGIVFLQRMMMVLSLIGLVLYVFGKDMFRVLAFPLIFLVFMVPIPESVVNLVSFPLQTYATIIAEKIIRLCAIPVYREGHMLYFSTTQLEVAEACSGIRSMTALLMLSVIFVSQWKDNRVLKVIFILSSFVIALVCNICRVSGTGILAHFMGDGAAKGFLHEFSGFAVFALGFLLLFGEYKLLSRMRPERRDGSYGRKIRNI